MNERRRVWKREKANRLAEEMISIKIQRYIKIPKA